MPGEQYSTLTSAITAGMAGEHATYGQFQVDPVWGGCIVKGPRTPINEIPGHFHTVFRGTSDAGFNIRKLVVWTTAAWYGRKDFKSPDKFLKWADSKKANKLRGQSLRWAVYIAL